MRAVPLDSSHLRPGPEAGASVSLVSIGQLRLVNRIPQDQTLTFGPSPGLTVVYGDNGTGKSGYARVIKKACRSRGAAPVIRPDAYGSSPRGAATGKITIRLAGPDEVVTWTDGVAADSRLANVFVFDFATAANYLEEDGPATFTPLGLDVLPKLSQTCDSVARLLKDEIDSLNAAISAAPRNWKFGSATEVGKLLSSISAGTARTAVESLGGLSELETQRLKELSASLAADPKLKAKETRAAAARVRDFAEKAASAVTVFNAEAVDSLRDLVAEARTAKAAAKALSEGRFDESHLPKTGGKSWRVLWEAARTYSEKEAYVGADFPVVSNGARCVLCQQRIDALAAQRLRAFEEFCKDRSQVLAERAAERLSETEKAIIGSPSMQPELEKVEADLAGLGPGDLDRIREFVRLVDEGLVTVRENLTADAWKVPRVLPKESLLLPAGYAGRLDERARLEESAVDPLVRRELSVERDELADREWLGRAVEDVWEQVKRYQRVAALETCKKDTVTTQITSKNSELTRALVTDAFCERFQEEVIGLSLKTIKVELVEASGKKGEKKFGLRLNRAPGMRVKDVASEGEQRCMALAAFLAELSLASHSSALVFDDPVSSLDHNFREAVAGRLVLECKSRQVIVLTHDAAFLNHLQTNAEKLGVMVEYRHLEWNGDSPGQCVEGVPWDYKGPEDLLDGLGKRQRQIARSWSPIPNEQNVREIRQAYSLLRAAVESIVERVVFAGVVSRFRSYVDLKKLSTVVGFQASECEELRRIFDRCSDVTEAHAAPTERQSLVPTPADLGKDIGDAGTVLNAIRGRQKALGRK